MSDYNTGTGESMLKLRIVLVFRVEMLSFRAFISIPLGGTHFSRTEPENVILQRGFSFP